MPVRAREAGRRQDDRHLAVARGLQAAASPGPAPAHPARDSEAAARPARRVLRGRLIHRRHRDGCGYLVRWRRGTAASAGDSKSCASHGPACLTLRF